MYMFSHIYYFMLCNTKTLHHPDKLCYLRCTVTSLSFVNFYYLINSVSKTGSITTQIATKKLKGKKKKLR